MTTAWLVRCGDGGRNIDDAVNRGVITVDFADATDVTGLPAEEIATQLVATKSRMAISRLAEMLFAFANEIAEGDVIISSDRARRQVVLGRVTGGYEWAEGAAGQFDHTRRMDWTARWGWDDLPEPVKHTVLHFQRTVLQFPDQESALQLMKEADESGLPPVYTPPVRQRASAAIDLRLEGASRSEKLCTSCFIIRPRSEFEADAETCRVCA